MKRHKNNHNNYSNHSRPELGAERPELVCFSDGETAFRIDKPGQQLDIAPLLDKRFGSGGGMLGSDGALNEAVVVTETGSVYYFDDKGLMVNMKDGTASDQHAESGSWGSEPNERLGDVVVGKPLLLQDRITSPVEGVYYNYARRVFSESTEPGAPNNPFPQCREAAEKAMKELRPETYQRLQALQHRLGKEAVR